MLVCSAIFVTFAVDLGKIPVDKHPTDVQDKWQDAINWQIQPRRTGPPKRVRLLRRVGIPKRAGLPRRTRPTQNHNKTRSSQGKSTVSNQSIGQEPQDRLARNSQGKSTVSSQSVGQEPQDLADRYTRLQPEEGR